MTVTDRRQTPSSRHREGAPQRQQSNFQTENNIWSHVPEWTWHQDVLTDWPSVVTWLWLWLVVPTWSRFPDGCLTPRQTGRLTRSRSHITTDGQSASSSWCLAPFGESDCLSSINCNFNCGSRRSRSRITTDSQSASLSWCQAPIWDPRPISLSPWNFLLTVTGL
jgi:hypothetical protein